MPTRTNDAGGSEDRSAATATDLDADLSPSEEALRGLARVEDVSIAQAAELLGTRFGHFRVVAVLGRGGMGVVYRAEDETLRRDVALKVLPPSVSGSEERRRRFLREARAAAALSHPNIAVIHEIGEAGGQLYIAMELIRGQSLAARLAKQRLNVGEALGEARQILSGLANAHEAGFVHRDLKPDNVMITKSGVVKVLDFGLAKPQGRDLPVSGSAETETAALTEEGSILGTPSYMSPEQARGAEVDHRSDIFSFGVVLYEMLTGERPFRAGTTADLLTALLRDHPEPVHKRNPEVSPELSAIVARCLAKEPEGRYADCKSLLADLDRVSAAGPARRSKWSHAMRGGAMLGIAGLLMAGVMVWRSQRAVAPAPAPSASAAAPGPTAVTDLPLPPSHHPEALAAYRRGMEQLRTGGRPSESFERAVELDPSLAAAHLQLAAYVGATESEREHFLKAEALRSALSPRDQALLDGLDPILRRQPSDWAEATRRLQAAVERFPHDAQLWFALAMVEGNGLDMESAMRHVDRALAEDASYSEALNAKGWGLAYFGRFDEAREVLEGCNQTAPASDCATNLGEIMMHVGACAEAEHVARQVIAAGIHLAGAHGSLATTLAAQGKPIATVHEALQRRWAETPERFRARVELVDRIQLASWIGDFDTAEQHARAYFQKLESSRRREEHGFPVWWIVQILEETGRIADAGRAAMDFLNRQDAWEPDPRAEDFAIAWDYTPSFLAVARRAGLLRPDEFTARRADWIQGWEHKIRGFDRKTPSPTRNYLWLQGYAAVVENTEDARDALDTLPRYTPIPVFRPRTLSWGGVGRAYLLMGQTDEAIRWLEDATKICSGFWFPFEHTRAFAWLGQAREAKGDKAGACAAYQAVLDRWGHAKPRSVTADKARERMKALKCSPK